MKNSKFETIIGGLVLLIALLFFIVILGISKHSSSNDAGYEVFAEFGNIEGLSLGSDVKVAGVKVGSVSKVFLNTNNYNASVILNIQGDLKIPTDSVFKVSSSGLMGGKFVNIKIGGMDEYFENGGVAEFTESTMDLEDLISRFVFNSESKDEKKDK